MIQMLINLCKKYSQIISYLVFGVLTTILNYVIYLGCTRIFHFESYISITIAWIIAVFFAYITNKRYVFDSTSSTKKDSRREFLSFFYFRAISLIFDMAAMWLMVSVMGMNDAYAKILSNIIVVIANYIFSKFFIFK